MSTHTQREAEPPCACAAPSRRATVLRLACAARPPLDVKPRRCCVTRISATSLANACALLSQPSKPPCAASRGCPACTPPASPRCRSAGGRGWSRGWAGCRARSRPRPAPCRRTRAAPEPAARGAPSRHWARDHERCAGCRERTALRFDPRRALPSHRRKLVDILALVRREAVGAVALLVVVAGAVGVGVAADLAVARLGVAVTVGQIVCRGVGSGAHA
eukprot:3680788-Prymnesium_polylepis.2